MVWLPSENLNNSSTNKFNHLVFKCHILYFAGAAAASAAGAAAAVSAPPLNYLEI